MPNSAGCKGADGQRSFSLILPLTSSRGLRGIWRVERQGVWISSHARSLTRLNSAGLRDDTPESIPSTYRPLVCQIEPGEL
jgi:hypothetical protein